MNITFNPAVMSMRSTANGTINKNSVSGSAAPSFEGVTIDREAYKFLRKNLKRKDMPDFKKFVFKYKGHDNFDVNLKNGGDGLRMWIITKLSGNHPNYKIYSQPKNVRLIDFIKDTTTKMESVLKNMKAEKEAANSKFATLRAAAEKSRGEDIK